MDNLSYNGVTFNIIKTIGVEREVILDPSNTTYLYTRWRGNFILTYGPGAAAFTRTPPPDPVNGFAGGVPPVPSTGANIPVLPALTDVTVRALLERPRGKLQIMSAGTVVIQSPQFMAANVVAPCDANNGPFIKVNSITKIAGERMWEIHIAVEASVVETSVANIQTIMSNRWSVEGATNWQQITTRTYQGLVTVRADALRSAIGGVPAVGFIDALRNSFLAFSVPLGFQRTAVNVRVLPDGNSAEYTVVDTQQQWDKGANSPAARVEVQDSGWYFVGSFGGAVFTLDLSRTLPKAYRRVHVRAWGWAGANRVNLTGYAVSIAMQRLGVSATWDVDTSSLIIAQDTNNYVDVSYTRQWDYNSMGAVGFGYWFGTTLASGVDVIPPGLQQWINIAVQGDDISAGGPGGYPPLTHSRIGTAPRPNPAFYAGGTRGQWLGTLITQILEAPDAAPANPP